MQELKQLYIDTFHCEPKTVEQLKGAGSNRQYYRFCDADGCSVIGAVGTSVEENGAFIYLSNHFKEKNLPVPEVYAVSEDKLRYLQQDLGSRSLFDAIADGREKGGKYSEEEIALLENTIRQLPRIQVLGAEGLDWNVCYPQPSFDKQNVFFDLNYFKYCFLKATNIDFNEIKLEADFQAFAEDLAPLNPPERGDAPTCKGNVDSLPRSGELEGAFMYRDFQARNIMLDAQGNPLFIDFQGGRRGPLSYDIASFLWQASARYPQSLRDHLIDVYFEELQGLCQSQGQSQCPTREAFDKQLSSMVLFRLLQVLGAYGFRGYFERKQHFIDSIPPALENLRNLLAEHDYPYPYLVEILNAVIEKLQPAAESQDVPDSPKSSARSLPRSGESEGALTVRIFSFSFKKGIPQDPSGNGGGYVFDCRSTHNPGRYEPYKKITGLDPRVIKFLEDDGEIVNFLQSVYKLADFHIERYLQRGFTSLMFSFGCTGGQHRSVYSAQHLADRIRKKYPQVKVELCHREQERPHALIFAAGLGTRLKPLTDTMPKALVRVGEKTLLERTIDTLKAVGIDHMTVNVHHFSDQIKNFLADYKSKLKSESKSNIEIRISDETDKLLDTGGGLLKAREQFNGVAPILIHNVDIISNANLERLMAESKANDAVATLLVSRRETSRYLIFDRDNNLVGWKNIKTGEVKGSEPAGSQMFAFSGIHIVKQSIFPLLEEYAQRPPLTPPKGEDETIRTANPPLVGESEGASGAKFGITDFYLWACQRAKIQCLVQDDLQLTDVGKLDTLAQLNAI